MYTYTNRLRSYLFRSEASHGVKVVVLGVGGGEISLESGLGAGFSLTVESTWTISTHIISLWERQCYDRYVLLFTYGRSLNSRPELVISGMYLIRVSCIIGMSQRGTLCLYQSPIPHGLRMKPGCGLLRKETTWRKLTHACMHTHWTWPECNREGNNNNRRRLNRFEDGGR